MKGFVLPSHVSDPGSSKRLVERTARSQGYKPKVATVEARKLEHDHPLPPKLRKHKHEPSHIHVAFFLSLRGNLGTKYLDLLLVFIPFILGLIWDACWTDHASTEDARFESRFPT